MKRYFYLGAIVVSSAFSGAYFFRPMIVRAQTENVVNLTLIETGMSGNHGSAKVPGDVIGFSCATNARSGAPECYVLSH